MTLEEQTEHNIELMQKLEPVSMAVTHQIEATKSMLMFTRDKFTDVEWTIYIACLQKLFNQTLTELSKIKVEE